jgi:hypothetical protein
MTKRVNEEIKESVYLILGTNLTISNYKLSNDDMTNFQEVPEYQEPSCTNFITLSKLVILFLSCILNSFLEAVKQRPKFYYQFERSHPKLFK